MDNNSSDIQHLLSGSDDVAPTSQMTSHEFASSVIAICVNPVMVAGEVSLECASDRDEAAKERLHQAFASLAPSHAADAWARESLARLFERSFGDDVWHSCLPGGRPVVIIKQSALDNLGLNLEDALKRVHLTEVASALRGGQKVPAGVVEEYKVNLESINADRDLY